MYAYFHDVGKLVSVVEFRGGHQGCSFRLQRLKVQEMMGIGPSPMAIDGSHSKPESMLALCHHTGCLPPLLVWALYDLWNPFESHTGQLYQHFETTIRDEKIKAFGPDSLLCIWAGALNMGFYLAWNPTYYCSTVHNIWGSSLLVNA